MKAPGNGTPAIAKLSQRHVARAKLCYWLQLLKVSQNLLSHPVDSDFDVQWMMLSTHRTTGASRNNFLLRDRTIQPLSNWRLVGERRGGVPCLR